MSTLTLTLPPHVAALFEKDEDARRRLEVLAARMVDGGGEIEAALKNLLDSGDSPAPAPQEQGLTEGQKRIRQALQELSRLPFPSGIDLDNSREIYYVDDHGRLPGMDGYGRDE